MNDILFSIVIPTYNRANMIPVAIESVLAQTYTNWELIIVDDGSTDNTREVVRKYCDKRIKYYQQENKGRSTARNKGIDISSGSYICLLDDDDYYLEIFLSNFYTEIKKHNHSSILYMCEQFEHYNEKLIRIRLNKKELLKNPVKYLILKSNNLQPFVIPKKILEKEKFDSRFELGEDFHLLVKLLINCKLIFINKPMCVYNNHKHMTMKRELNNSLFIDLRYNRMDVLNDLLINHRKELTNLDALRGIIKKHNQVCYFYASAALKNGNMIYSIDTIKKIKLDYLNIIYFYYILSIFIRFPYYFLKSKL